MVRCPECRRRIEIAPDDFGHTVECPYCEERFVAGEVRDHADDYYARLRRPRRYGDAQKASIRAAAAKAIVWPSQGLMWTGAICTVLSVIAGIALFVAGFVTANRPGNAPGSAWVFFIYAGYVGGAGSIYYLLLAIAGFQMKKLRHKGWFIAGAALGIASMFFCGIIMPSTWAALTFGIMSLTALSKREVQDALAINSTEEF